MIDEDDLAAWRAHPVTEYVFGCLKTTQSEQIDICKEAAWVGRPWPDHERRALHLVGQIINELMTASAEDMAKIMEIHEE